MDRKFTPAETEKLITRAQKQFKSYMDWEGDFRQSFAEDIRFANGDADNQWQWDGTVLQSRKDCPSMTINMTWIHCALVQNEIKKNPPSITVRPVGGGATMKSAEVYGGLIREISRASDAINIYLKASETLVQGGVGYWRVLTEYESEDSFDQVIRIRSLRNPLGAAMDPDAKEPSGADANWAMIFEDVKNEYLEDEHEKYKDSVGSENAITANIAASDWKNEDYTRVAEWYEKEKFQDQLLGYADPESGAFSTAFLGDIKDSEIKQRILADPKTQKRPVTRSRICWYKIFGDKIVDYREVPGKRFIPIVRVVGQETIIDGNLDRKGIVRGLKDSQRNMNYWVSAGAMQVALQTNVPWVGPAEAFENIKQWEDANRGRFAYLPYNHKDADGEALPPPTRPAPPVLATAYIQGIQIASQQFKDITGQHEATLGKQDNAESSLAIRARQGQGETSTFHFPNALAQGVAHTGRIILDMAPEVYDTPRLIRISNADMSQSEVNVDPAAQVAHAEAKKQDEENTTEVTWNPKVGRYEVEAEAGPSYQTQREWAAESLGQILAQNKDLWQVIGDFYAQNLDFPGAEEMAERIRRTMNPAVLGEGPSPGEQKMQGEMQNMQRLLQSLMDTLAQKQRELDDKNDEITIKAEDAVTKRMDAESRRIKEAGNAQANFAAAGLEPDIRNIMADATAEAINPDLAATLAEREPQPEAAETEMAE
jgi:hypothetical protein